jgi:hypothetical protein
MSAERGWIGDPQPSVEWRDSHYSRQADRINTQPDPLRGEGGRDAELARRIPLRFPVPVHSRDEADRGSEAPVSFPMSCRGSACGVRRIRVA